MLITPKRIPEQTEEVSNGDHYQKRVKAMMLQELYPFFIERMIKEVGFGPGKALEIGPGPLPLGLFFCKQTQWEVVGVDISEEMIDLARNVVAQEDLKGRYRAKLANAESLPFDTGTFDLIFTSGSLHHWLSPEKVFQEIERVLAPGGTVVIFDLCREVFVTEEEFSQVMDTVEEQYREGLLDSLKAAYIPQEIYNLLQTSGRYFVWQRVQFEQYHRGMARFNQSVILRKPLHRQIRG